MSDTNSPYMNDLIQEAESLIERLNLAVSAAKVQQRVDRSERPWPQYGDTVYMIDPTGESGVLGDSYEDTEYEQQLLKAGELFEHFEEAQFTFRHRQIERLMRQMADGMVGKEHWRLIYDTCSNEIGCIYGDTSDYGIPIFATRESAQMFVETIGEDTLKKYWFVQ